MCNAEVRIMPGRKIGKIDPRIYGQYIENLTPDDRPIYGGVCDEDGELRPSVIEALQTMRVPMIRWGGNYADVYRWTDGIGPKESRPTRPNYFWGGMESNRFGTHEFLELCDSLSAQPYISINMGTGGLLEALGWLEYCNFSGDTYYTRLRQSNGREKPWHVPIWGIGNEAWGYWESCFAPPEDYVRDFNQYAQYMRKLDPSIELVAVGHTDRHWNKTVLTGMRVPAEFLSIHMYGHSFLEREGNYEQLVALPQAFEQEISEAVDDLKAHASSPIALIIDEWNVRHLHSNSLNRQSPRQLQDALFVAGIFNVYHRFSNHVTAANYVTIVNGNAPIRAWDDTIELTPVFEVFRLYQELMQGDAVEIAISSPQYVVSPFIRLSTPHTDAASMSVSTLDASAVTDEPAGTLTLALINRSADYTCTVVIDLDDKELSHFAKGWRLYGTSPNALNACVSDDVIPTSQDGNRWQVSLEPTSITWLQWCRSVMEEDKHSQ